MLTIMLFCSRVQDELENRLLQNFFARNEYKSYILIDFSKATDNIKSCFNDIGNLNIFFLRLQAETGVTLYEHESLIIFDEVQLFPKARQAIKHLVSDGRYHYLEIRFFNIN